MHLHDNMPHSQGSKPCSKCGVVKPLTTDFFHREHTMRDGFASRCKECKRLPSRARRERYYAANAETERAKAKAYYHSHKEWAAAYAKKNHALKKEQIANKQRESRSKKREKISQYNRAYRLQNREKLRVYKHWRRARQHASPERHTANDIKRQHKAQGGKCYYCHADAGSDYQVDHVIPLSRGGSDGPENIVIACRFCNQSKKDKLPHEWPQGNRLL